MCCSTSEWIGCPVRRPKKQKVEPLRTFPRQLSNLMSRIRIDMQRASAIDEGAALVKAAMSCRDCDKLSACDDWNSSREEGEGAPPPEFCKLRPFLKAAEPVQKARGKPKPIREAAGKKKSVKGRNVRRPAT